MGSRVRVPSPPPNAVMRYFTKNFFDSRERPALGPVVELAYTASSNLAAYGIGGSSPSGATNHFARVVKLADTTV